MLLQNVQDEFAEILNSGNTQCDIFLPSENMVIYRNNMVTNLTHALQETYKIIVKLVGEDFFRTAAKEYIDRYPSQSGNLHDYGEYFADFLQEYEPVEDLPYLPEVAKFEWACHLLYFASDALPFDIKLLETVSSEHFHQLSFSFHPASRLIQFQYPVTRIVELYKGEIDEEINLNEEGVNLLLIRLDTKIRLITLSLSEFSFLSALARGETLGNAVEETVRLAPEFRVDESLPKWIQKKVLVDFFVVE